MVVEIDFLWVGERGRSGDAIALRYGPAGGPFEVIVVDGGTKESGEQLVAHIRQHYGTNKVAHVVNSHPDGDHSSGLSVVVDEMEVGALWMHRPWEHAEIIRHLFHDGRITDSSLEDTIREALESAHDLEQLAIANQIRIFEPYEGHNIGPFRVLGPHQNWYLQDLVPNFRGTPKPKESIAADSFMGGIAEMLKSVVTTVAESMDVETLTDGGTTSAENDSSVILWANFGGNKLLLTGDAGIEALTRAQTYAASVGASLDDLWLAQIPHHGSRNNVSPAVLDKMRAKFAIASAAKADTHHPHKKVTNAYKRRGARVWVTNGQTKHVNIGLPREGWSPAEEEPFYPEVEA